MKKFEHEYMIYTIANEDVYHKQCAALEMHIPSLRKLEELHDVDDSRIQRYELNGKRIRVLNDLQLNAVHVESEIPLEVYFQKKEAAAS